MEKYLLNYRVIVEPDIRIGTNEKCYSAYCPTLGIADDGDTVDQVLANIKEGIQCFVEALIKEGKEVPSPDNLNEGIVSGVFVKLSSKPLISPL
ncbi:type II toxin-antitoxin system HicB family antitoxin [Candidatus Daviesbacteria bacterium]|nr:type II toxin-antitoxin system HicB family antitoxin [Candidatus Daviesbacteria bacterium]